MPRILFTKEGNAVWISHLDLMRLLMRAFRRAGILLKHSQGFSPHPELSILMPLSVGVSSQCEIAEFALTEEDETSPPAIAGLLNPVLPQGIRILESYEGGQKAGRLRMLESRLTLVYDREIPEGGAEALEALFHRSSLPVEKHSKKGPVTVDLAPMLQSVQVSAGNGALILRAIGSAQNPTLNPLLMAAAVETFLPDYRPDFVRCHRVEVYGEDGSVFR